MSEHNGEKKNYTTYTTFYKHFPFQKNHTFKFKPAAINCQNTNQKRKKKKKKKKQEFAMALASLQNPGPLSESATNHLDNSN